MQYSNNGPDWLEHWAWAIALGLGLALGALIVILASLQHAAPTLP